MSVVETPQLPHAVKIKEEDCLYSIQNDHCLARTGQNESEFLEYDCKTENDTAPCTDETLFQHCEESEMEYGHNSRSFAISSEFTSEATHQNEASGSLEELEASEQPVVNCSNSNNCADYRPNRRSPDSAFAIGNGSNCASPPDTGRPPMREPCGVKCRRRCTERISGDRRREIWSKYWCMSQKDKRQFVFNSVSQVQKARVCVSPSRRNRSFIYRLKDAGEIPQQVCKMFFLSTLGYHPCNDRLVLSVMGRHGKEMTPALSPPIDRRGRHEPANKLDLEPLYAHIESCHPVISHYQRKDVPCRRYLPSDVSVKLMYADYIDKGNHCSYETYRKAVKSKNIGFTKLGEEECENCVLQDQHLRADHLGEEASENCLHCERWRQHKTEAEETRLHYMSDADRDWPEDTSVRSVSPQKVIMLPRMPGIKSALSTRRIAAYQETFSSVEKKSNKRKNISVVWHEGIAGRNAKEITSVYQTALEKERDIKHVIYWMDNHSAHNKNWCLLSSLVSLVNSDNISTEDITLKFFEPGHTPMSADHFHQGVEQEMRRRQGGLVYDFEDFISVVANSNSKKVEVIELKNEDIRDWTDGHSDANAKEMPRLSELKVIQLRRGSLSMFVKISHKDDDFIEVDFIQKDFRSCIPSVLRPHGCGVEEATKVDILKNLVPLMPPTRSLFWMSLTVRNLSEYEDEE